jgi:hypothetical protein
VDVGLLLWLCACSSASTPVPDHASEPESEAPAAITLREVDFVHSRGSSVFARGHVAAMTYIRENGETVAHEAGIRFPRDQHPGSAVDLSSPLARGNPLEARVAGEGGVRFENAQGDRGQTEKAAYDGKRGEALGDSAVQLFGPGFEISSPGFRWQAATDELDLGPSKVVSTGPSTGLSR